MEQPQTCKKCGTSFATNAKFCNECGARRSLQETPKREAVQVPSRLQSLFRCFRSKSVTPASDYTRSSQGATRKSNRWCLPCCGKKPIGTSSSAMEVSRESTLGNEKQAKTTPSSLSSSLHNSAETVKNGRSFNLKPSVGTWLIKPFALQEKHIPMAQRISQSMCLEPNQVVEDMPKSMTNTRSELVSSLMIPGASKKVSSFDNEIQFSLKPSVGTWLGEPFKLSDPHKHRIISEIANPGILHNSPGERELGYIRDTTLVKVVNEDHTVADVELDTPSVNRDDEALLDLISPGFEIKPIYKVGANTEQPVVRQRFWPPRNSAQKVHPETYAASTRRPHPSQPQRVYISSDYGDARGDIVNSSGIDHNIGTDIDACRDRAPVRHRIVQRVSSIHGTQVGQLKVERLVAHCQPQQMLDPNPPHISSTSLNGWYRVQYRTSAEMAADLQLTTYNCSGDVGGLSTSYDSVFVAAVAAGGVAQAAGICAGLRVAALNGNSDCLREQLGYLLTGQSVLGPITLDLISPAIHCNANPSYGDVWARAPLSTPGFVDHGG